MSRFNNTFEQLKGCPVWVEELGSRTPTYFVKLLKLFINRKDLDSLIISKWNQTLQN